MTGVRASRPGTRPLLGCSVLPKSLCHRRSIMLPGTGTPADFASPASTSLDPIESTPQQDPVSLLFNPPSLPDAPVPTFRHQSWHQRRIRIASAMAVADLSRRRTSAFLTCGCQAWVLRSVESPNDFRVVPDFCRDRWCVPCANGRAARIAANLLEHLQNEQTRFVTLTLKASDDPLRARIDRLLAAFSKLRRRVFWKERVSGGAGFLHITRGKDGTHWHPHLHLIVQGKYLPKKELVDAWLQITADSYVVDIMYVHDPRLVGRYVTQYASKPLDPKLLREPAALTEAINSLRGRKLLYAFGAWARWELLANPSDAGWTLYGHVNELMYKATNGDELADLVLLVLQHSPDIFAGDTFTVDLRPEPPPCPKPPVSPTMPQTLMPFV